MSFHRRVSALAFVCRLEGLADLVATLPIVRANYIPIFCQFQFRTKIKCHTDIPMYNQRLYTGIIIGPFITLSQSAIQLLLAESINFIHFQRLIKIY